MKTPFARPAPPASTIVDPAAVSRRGFLRTSAMAGGGLIALGVAACQPGTAPTWSYQPGGTPWAAAPSSSPAGSPGPSGAPAASTDHSAAPSASSEVDHDANALAVVERFLGGEAGQLEGTGNQPLEPTRVEAGVKVWDMTIDRIKHRIDARKEPLDALGYNGTWPAPRITVVEGDRVRFNFTNKLDESTGVHFHGQRLPNNMDGVPHVTQDPITPGQAFTYEFTARTPGSHMYHSHHNATDQVGRGLLGAFIVEPRDPAQRYQALHGTEPGHHLDQQRRAGRVHDQRPRVSGHRSDRRHAWREDRDPVHERGKHDASLASPRDADACRCPRRLSARLGGVHVRHARCQPGRALGCRDRLRRARGVGIPLPHPPPRRGSGGHVRHGHRAGRRRPRRRRPGRPRALLLPRRHLSSCTSLRGPAPPG